MKAYFVLYKQQDSNGSVEILAVYEDRQQAEEAERRADINSGYFETVRLEEVYMG